MPSSVKYAESSSESSPNLDMVSGVAQCSAPAGSARKRSERECDRNARARRRLETGEPDTGGPRKSALLQCRRRVVSKVSPLLLSRASSASARAPEHLSQTKRSNERDDSLSTANRVRILRRAKKSHDVFRRGRGKIMRFCSFQTRRLTWPADCSKRVRRRSKRERRRRTEQNRTRTRRGSAIKTKH